MNAVLIDDELNALKSLAWEIETFCNDVTVIGQFSDPLEALKYVEKNTVDIIFLDIEMPGLNGFQFIDLCPAKGLKIIITTAYDQYAIQAIKKRAFDYLLKPIDSDDLKECVEKIKFEINQEKLHVDIEKILLDFTSKTNSNYQRLSFNSESKLFFYNADDILYVKSEGNNSYIYFDKTKN
ncbi:response regulator [Flavobacterium piscinae]|uniref:LytR/AlgR family response regulator transcription factor n=1 Tax=Flavobacterium piscinae TaxID=2506424 RepID=UPI0019887CDB|nr:response regulator [Flavobacterium piscinae]MBC8883821.1 response regulator [Flavobacterium piscinae]